MSSRGNRQITQPYGQLPIQLLALGSCHPGRCVISGSHSLGVNTCDIITLYISAIKALRVLDPSMVILEVACEPIRRYLR